MAADPEKSGNSQGFPRGLSLSLGDWLVALPIPHLPSAADGTPEAARRGAAIYADPGP